MDGKKIARIVKLVLGITGVFAVLVVLFLHSYSQRSQMIMSYLNYRYGVKADDSEDVTIFGDEFTLTTEEGINVCGTCDFFGNIKTDSYVNYYYADECADHIRDEIGAYFSDSVIIYDGIKLSELASLPLKTRAINSYDEYVAATKDAWENADEHNYYYKISIRVYIRESEYIGNIRDAIAQLKDNDEYFDVYFYTVPDELFDLHKEKEVHAYFRGKAFDELDDYLDKETAVKLEDLIYHQSGCAGKYCQWKQIDVSDNDVSHVEEGPMLVISSTIEGPIDYYNDDRVLGVT